MRKLILVVILISSMATMVQAADQVIIITIPDQHVSRVAAAVNGTLNCGELGSKACLKKELITNIKKLVRRYESKPIMEDANTQIGNLVDPEIE